MTIHIFTANRQPATRYVVHVGDHRFTMRCRRRTQIRCFSCGRHRWAAYLTAQVYYDGVYFHCKAGHGCKAKRR
jgi:hypothetical protein